MTNKENRAAPKENHISELESLVFVAYGTDGKPHKFARNSLEHANTIYVACRECAKFFLIELENESQKYNGAPPFHNRPKIYLHLSDDKACSGSYMEHISEEEWNAADVPHWKNLSYPFDRVGYRSVFINSVEVIE